MDEADWTSTRLPPLAAFEETLRCSICKDFFKVPTSTPCGHTFCSVCIRRHLGATAKCPICQSASQTAQLRTSKTIEDVVELWEEQRGRLYDLIKVQAVPVPAADSGDTLESSLQATQQDEPAQTDNFNTSNAETEPAKPTRLVSLRTRSTISLPDARPDARPDTRGQPAQAATADCPICGKTLPVTEIQGSHIEKCLQKPAPSRRDPFQTRPQKKPLLNYMNYQDKALRKLLSDEGLSTQGPRQRMIARHKEWLLHWNSNVESKRPEPLSVLRRRMTAWEAAMDSVPAKPSSDFDNSAWSSSHDTEFDELRDQAFAQLGRGGPRKRSLEEITASMAKVPKVD